MRYLVLLALFFCAMPACGNGVVVVRKVTVTHCPATGCAGKSQVTVIKKIHKSNAPK